MRVRAEVCRRNPFTLAGMFHAAYMGAGALVGVIIGLTGIGGGALMTPMLILVFRQAPVMAVGTDLVFAALTKIVATASFGFKRRVDWQVVLHLATGSVPAALATLAWLRLTHASGAAIAAVVTQGLAVMLVITAVALVLQGHFQRLGLQTTALTLARLQRLQPGLTTLAGALLGVAVTLTSVGAGALGTVALLYIYPLRLTPSRLVATDLAHALPLAVIAGLGHAALGHVDYALLANLLAGSIPGVLVGTACASRAPGWLIRVLVATMLLVSGARMLLPAGPA